MVDGHAELVWCGLKISGLMDPDEASPGAQDLRYEGRSSVEMAEHTSPTFFLFPSLTIAWALWVLEGLHLLALKGFSREQLHVSTYFLGVDGFATKGKTVTVCPIWGLGTDWLPLA